MEILSSTSFNEEGTPSLGEVLLANPVQLQYEIFNFFIKLRFKCAVCVCACNKTT